MLNYDNKVQGSYRMCKILAVKKSADGLVRTVTVGLRDRRKKSKTLTDWHAPLVELDVGVARVVLLKAAEESEGGGEVSADDEVPLASSLVHLNSGNK